MQILKLNNKKWRHNKVITKNNGKIQTFWKPNTIVYHSKGIDPKRNCYCVWATVTKVMDIFLKF